MLCSMCTGQLADTTKLRVRILIRSVDTGVFTPEVIIKNELIKIRVFCQCKLDAIVGDLLVYFFKVRFFPSVSILNSKYNRSKNASDTQMSNIYLYSFLKVTL